MIRLLVAIFCIASGAALAQNTFFAGSQGDMIYRGATGWAPVPGAQFPGQVLMSQGTTAQPIWSYDFSNVSALKLPVIATNRILGNVTGGTSNPVAIDVNQLLDTVGYDIQRPPLVGSILYKSSTAPSSTWQALPPPTQTTGMVLTSGGPGQAPYWGGNQSPAGPIAPYTVTGGTTARSDVDRWVDAGIEVSELGVDCTGATDAATILQNYFTSNPSGHIKLAYGCSVLIGSTITITDGAGTSITGPTDAGNGGSSSIPRFIWDGNATTPMFSFVHVDHPIIENLYFTTNAASTTGYPCPTGFLKFDGTGGSHIGTAGRLRNLAISGTFCRNSNLIAVDISNASVANYENFIVDNLFISCGASGLGGRIATDGVTNGTTTVTSAGGPFFAGMRPNTITAGAYNSGLGTMDFTTSDTVDGLTGSVVTISGVTPSVYNGNFFVTAASGNTLSISVNNLGAYVSGGAVAGMRMRISYGGGTVDTTVATFVSATEITVANAPSFTQTDVQIIAGSLGFGIGVRNGASQNAIQQQFKNIQYQNCGTGVHLQGGNAAVTQATGGTSDIGVFVGGFVAQNTLVDYYASESDIEGLVIQAGIAAPITVTNSRFSNGDQRASGHITLGSNIVFQSNLFNFAPPTNGVLINKGSGSPIITSINNIYPASYPNSGLSAITSPPVNSISDQFADFTSAPGVSFFGCYAQSIPCFTITAKVPNAGGIGLSLFTTPAINSPSVTIGAKIYSDVTNASAYTGIQSWPTTGRVTTFQTLYEAGWNQAAVDVTTGMIAGIGFKATTPSSVTGGTLANLYGVFISRQKITNVTNGWGIAQVDANDSNQFIGSVLLGDVSGAATPTTGALVLANSASTFKTTLQAGNAAAARTWTLPTNYGTFGCVLRDLAANGSLSCSTLNASVTVGTTPIVSGTTTRFLYDNAGVVGETAGVTFPNANSIRLATVTYASLATCNSGNAGAKAVVSDSSATPTFTATLTGGGTITVPVYCDGAVGLWRAG